MAAAVLAQGLQSLMRYGNKVCVGYFAARCRASITALIHRQVLSFSFPCASHGRAVALLLYKPDETLSLFAGAVAYLPWLLIRCCGVSRHHCFAENP